jgi:amino acid permease
MKPKMKKNPPKSKVLIVGIILILIVLLSKRLLFKNLNMDGALSFLAGFAVIVISFLILKVILKNKK